MRKACVQRRQRRNSFAQGPIGLVLVPRARAVFNPPRGARGRGAMRTVLNAESGSLAELLVDESPGALFALGRDGRLLSWNRGAAAIFCYTSEEAIVRSL